MKLKAKELENKGYEFNAELNIKDMAPFIMKWIGLNNIFTRIFKIGIAISLAIIVLAFYHNLNQEIPTSLSKSFLQFIGGIGLSFLLIPIHEGLHGLAYKMKGASKVTYGANLSKMMFYAAADQYVVNREEFKFVALAPFITITFSLLLCFLFIPLEWKMICAGMLFFHTQACIGDFGMLSFFSSQDFNEVVTYDDLKSNTAYFYGKN